MPLPLGLLSLGAKFLGIGKVVKNFVKENWKWLLPVAIIVAGYFYVNNRIENAYEQGYEIGVQDEVEKQRHRVELENRKNREFENILERAVDSFGEKINRQNAQRVTRESELNTLVEERIRDNPIYQQCIVDKEVIDARNQIRALGPSDE